MERLLLHAAGGGGHGNGVRRVVMVLLLKCSQRGTRGCFQNDCRTLGSPSTIYTIVSKGEVNATVTMGYIDAARRLVFESEIRWRGGGMSIKQQNFFFN